MGRTRARNDFSTMSGDSGVKGLEGEVTPASSAGADCLRGTSVSCGSKGVGAPLRDLGPVWLPTRLTSGAGV
jgi:hypothetical protein